MLSISRRSFLADFARAAAYLPAAAVTFRDLSARLFAAEGDESYWEMVRQQFPFREEKVPMNAANLCPSPRVVAERVAELARDIDQDCSFNNRAKFEVLREEARRKVAEHLGVSAEEVALVRNTSEANNIINNGLALKSGDEVVLWDQNHPTNNVAWDVRAARFGLVVKRVTVPANPTEVNQVVPAFESVMGQRTRVLAITHVSNESGLLLPVQELCEMAHKRGIHVHLDGAQSWGALNVNLREVGCDSYAASAHKWLLGPKEVGMLFVRQEQISSIWPNVVAPGWGDDAEPDVKGARKFESLGQRNDASVSAIGTAVGFHHLLGPGRIQNRIYQLAQALRAGLQRSGVKIITPEDSRFSAGVIVFDVPAAKKQQVFDKLYHQYGIAGSTTGGIRLCPHIYNTMEHIDRAIRALEKLLA
jgi:selenocysteine lyase/cysteine desulfurase